MKARRSGVYLLGSLLSGIATVLAHPLLWIPRLARLWANWHRDRAGRLLGAPLASRPALRAAGRRARTGPATVRISHALLWLPVNAVTGVVFGLPANNAVHKHIGNTSRRNA
ncbi:hypothetical protein [Micromonospora aurantiaca (nom. illeg.)]|uniref:hypothetical protein n=1 Tax=Micromonospora aurantiaca (nom. illeg.) TaxID=47850 RepID=UPI0034017672